MQWRGMEFGNELVIIRNAQPADYIIAVNAFTNCTYTITASTEQAITTLMDGETENERERVKRDDEKSQTREARSGREG